MANNFNVVLTGNQETPPNTSAAHGLGTAVLDVAANTLTYTFKVTGVDFGPAFQQPPSATMTDHVMGMHFHSGASGMAGSIVFGQYNPVQDINDPTHPNDFGGMLNADGSWTIHGVWDLN